MARSRRARRSGSPGRAHLTIDQLYARDKGKCHLCGKHVPRDQATRDHLKPRSEGGKDGKLNQRLAHAACNQQRGSKPLPPEALKPTGRMRRL